MASSGVRLTAYIPAATTKSVAIRISRTFRLDQRMMAASIDLSFPKWRDRRFSGSRLFTSLGGRFRLSAGVARLREALQPRSEVAFGVDQKICADDNPFA